jgi:hypothetical protein
LSDGDAALGPPVPVSISLLGISAGDAEDVTRSAAPVEPVTETVTLGDGMLMEMSLAPDPAAELRADSFPLANGVKFLLIAVTAAEGEYLSHAEYTMDTSGPVSNDSVTVPWGWNCRFLCVSLNSSESPLDYATGLASGQTPQFTGIQGTTDLLYWRSDPMTVTAARTLLVALRHKLHSRIRVRVSTSYNNWKLKAVDNSKISLHYRQQSATLNADGTVTATGSATTAGPVFSWPVLATPDTVHTSNDTVAYLGNASLQIGISQNAFTLNDYGEKQLPTSSGTTYAVFSGVSLEPGKRYLLRLRVREPMFASSNIYWDGSKLTFDEYMPDPFTQNKYQGVYFKFGSLVGISPIGSATDAIVYIPTYNSVTPSLSTWDGSSDISNSTFGTYDAISYVSHGTLSERSNRYVSNLSVDTFTVRRGDICRYLELIGAAPGRPATPAGLHWSLPTSAEFGPTNAAWADAAGWTRTASWTGSTSTDDPSGRSEVISWGGLFGATSNLFPASGSRLTGGALSGVGNLCYYWSGSVYTTADNGRILGFNSSNVYPDYNYLRQGGFAVRCVLQE